jgi:hypothetical protein
MIPKSTGSAAFTGFRALLDHLVPDRTCGDCVACCRILEIDTAELKKSADVLCTHCTGKSCGIYETRPPVCQSWYCLWRRIDAMPEAARPDLCNVVSSIHRHEPPRSPFEKLYIVARAINSAEDLKHPIAVSAVEMFIRQGSLPVWVSFGGTKFIVYPSKQVREFVISGYLPPDHLTAEVSMWAERLAEA